MRYERSHRIEKIKGREQKGSFLVISRITSQIVAKFENASTVLIFFLMINLIPFFLTFSIQFFLTITISIQYITYG